MLFDFFFFFFFFFFFLLFCFFFVFFFSTQIFSHHLCFSSHNFKMISMFSQKKITKLKGVWGPFGFLLVLRRGVFVHYYGSVSI